MKASSLVLADANRADQFHLIGHSRRLLRPYEIWKDANGIAWAYNRIPATQRRHRNFYVALTWLGPGWVFDPAAPTELTSALPEIRSRLLQADDARHRQRFDEILAQVRVGPHAERLLWAIHREILAARTSEIRISDARLASAIWGTDKSKWQSNWRQTLLTILRGLAWLHVAEGGDEIPQFGAATALLNHVGDLRSDPQDDECALDCLDCGGPRHHHFLVIAAPGFLGVLEGFAAADAEGVRNYQFPVGARKHQPSLRTVGKTGRLMSIFLPAKLGDRTKCELLTANQHRLLQAVIRELSRKTKEERRDLSEAEVSSGGGIRSFNGRNRIPCPLLSMSKEYVTFGGNGKRKGLGYKLTSEGGWLAKSGYALGDLRSFLADAKVLADRLNLKFIGIDRADQYKNLHQITTLAASATGRNQLGALHVRCYTEADFLDRWSRYFGWRDPTQAPAHGHVAQLQTLIDAIKAKKITRRQLAKGIGQDPSFVNKVLNGKKRPPNGFLDTAESWVAQYYSRRRQAVSAVGPTQNENGTLQDFPAGPCLLPDAKAMLERGWSVVPKRPGAKQPCVKWKPYQDRLPTSAELDAWFEQWPDAGLAVALGPVSNLFVIDVDGPEAHQVLLEKMGAEPIAPKAISGSRKPFRYHLFFRHPDIKTKAKTTPWHPQLEFRGKGGIIVVPPSLHPSGNRYAWAEGRSLDDLPLPELPRSILDALAPVRRNIPPPPTIEVVGDVDASPATRQFLSGIFANSPGWNEKLFLAACDLAGRGMAIEEAEPLLLAGAGPWNSTEEDSAKRTIQSAFSQLREPARL